MVLYKEHIKVPGSFVLYPGCIYCNKIIFFEGLAYMGNW